MLLQALGREFGRKLPNFPLVGRIPGGIGIFFILKFEKDPKSASINKKKSAADSKTPTIVMCVHSFSCICLPSEF